MSAPMAGRHFWLAIGVLLATGACGASHTRALAKPTALPFCRIPAPVRDEETYAVVQGDLGKHKAYADMFMDGCTAECRGAVGTSCASSFGLSVPMSARARHLHLDEFNEDFSRYYRDPGLDSDAREGLENSTVLFYAGHGMPGFWYSFGRNVPGSSALNDIAVELKRTRLGEGRVRYQLMSSCEVMAHGPQEPQASIDPSTKGLGYSCPECPAIRSRLGDENVFLRWYGHFAPAMRMVCGGATVINSYRLPFAFWHYYSIAGLPVADSFILAAAHKTRIAMCLTQGGANAEDTPLFDRRFTAARNESGASKLYALFPVHGSGSQKRLGALGLSAVDGDEPREQAPDDWIPPVLAVDNRDDDALVPLNADKRSIARRLPYGFLGGSASLDGQRVAVRIQPNSRTLIASFIPGSMAPDGGRESLSEPLELLVGLPLAAKEERAFEAPSLVFSLATEVDSVSVDSLGDRPSREHVCDYLRVQRQLRVPGAGEDTRQEVVPVFGEGGEMLIRDCSRRPAGDDSLASLATAVGSGEWSFMVVDRRLKSEVSANDGPGKAVLRKAAEEQAWTQVAALEQVSVPVARQRFSYLTREVGYLAAPPHCRQETLQPVHRFTFVDSAPGEDERDRPMEIDVPFYRDSMAALQAEWSCSPAQPEIDASGGD